MNPDPTAADLAAPSRRLWTALACAVIVAAGIAVYSNSFNGPFIFDDRDAIQKNEAIRSPFQTLVPPGKGSSARRPLTNLTFALNYAFSGLDVRSYHAGNLLIHLLAGLTLFGVVRRTRSARPGTIECVPDKKEPGRHGRPAKEPSGSGRIPSSHGPDGRGRAGIAVSFAVALIWAVHPLQTESVTYMAQRYESLMGLCYLLTLYGLIRGSTSEKPSPPAPWAWARKKSWSPRRSWRCSTTALSYPARSAKRSVGEGFSMWAWRPQGRSSARSSGCTGRPAARGSG
jgi:hypothetical protein